MSSMASQITSLTIVYSNVYSGTDQRKHQSTASLAFVRGIHQWPVNSPHKGPVTQKMFPFDDVTMTAKVKTETQERLYIYGAHGMFCGVSWNIVVKVNKDLHIIVQNCWINLNSYKPGLTYKHWWIGSLLVQIMACGLFCAKPLAEQMLTNCNWRTFQWDLNPNAELSYHENTIKIFV